MLPSATRPCLHTRAGRPMPTPKSDPAAASAPPLPAQVLGSGAVAWMVTCLLDCAETPANLCQPGWSALPPAQPWCPSNLAKRPAICVPDSTRV